MRLPILGTRRIGAALSEPPDIKLYTLTAGRGKA
jgi:hypothetical protein